MNKTNIGRIGYLPEGRVEILDQVYARFKNRGTHLCYQIRVLATGEVAWLSAETSRKVEFP